MKNKVLLSALLSSLILLLPLTEYAQSFPPYENKKGWWVAPIVLTGGALLVGTENFKHGESQFYGKHFTNFHTGVEDFIQYAPNIAYLAANLKYDKKTIFEASKILIAANIFNFVGTKGMKFFSQIERPNKANYSSFPSGHTSMAFVGAHLIAKEFGKGDPLISISAYGVATATGLLRWANHDHWVSDIVGGAAMGIFATELAIRHLPKIMDKLDKNGRLSYEPMLIRDGGGLALTYKF
ncbi:MAG: hypothetical protein RIR51_398 [Bacteroidota bacterium]